jgi:hypothetical protein
MITNKAALCGRRSCVLLVLAGLLYGIANAVLCSNMSAVPA